MAAIRHPKDFWSGALFAAFGGFALIHGSRYSIGTAARMGPGYFPRILGIMMIVLGTILVLRSLRTRGTAVPPWRWRPTLLVLGSVIFFGLIVKTLGMALSTVILIVLASLASHEFRAREAIISGVLLAILAVLVFVVGLSLQLPIWPGQY